MAGCLGSRAGRVARISSRLDRVESKFHDLRDDRGYMFGQGSVVLSLNPHPFKNQKGCGTQHPVSIPTFTVVPTDESGFDEIGEGAGVGVEIREDRAEIGDAVVAGEDFGEDGAEISGESEVAAV